MTGPTMLSIQDVATLLAVSPKTVRGLIVRGELRAHRIGSCIRICPAAVDAYLDGHRVSVSAPAKPRPRSAPRARMGGLRAAFAIQHPTTANDDADEP